MDEKQVPTRAEAERAAMLLMANMRLMHGLRHEIRDSGLRPPQAAFLAFLRHSGPLNMSEMSRVSNVTTSVASRLIERLEAKGMVRRVPDASDRRVVMVELTEEGDRAATGLLEAYTARLQKSLEGLSQEDLDAFVRVLEHMNERLEADALPFGDECPGHDQGHGHFHRGHERWRRK